MIRRVAAARDAILKNKLTRDIMWSMGSFVILAISGIVINIAVAGFRDAAALGVFNLAYAVYIVASQFAAFGIHYSVLRYAAYYSDDPDTRGIMFHTASLLAVVLGCVAAVALWRLAPWLGSQFQSGHAGGAIGYAAFGLFLFPLNKVLLAYLNGLREMKAFSILQATRYLVVMIGVCSVAASQASIELSTFAFITAEIVTALGSFAVIVKKRLGGTRAISLSWVKSHFAFGTKGLASGMFAEVNSRVDVLLIGYFLNDRATGIYSFAAMLVDGLYHVIAMVRINFNPVLVAAVKQKEWASAQSLMKKTRQLVVPGVLGLAIVIAAAYWVLAGFILPGRGLMEGMPSLLILLTGVVLASSFVPFDNLMVVSGHPGFQALQQVGVVVANASVAILLLPVLGVEGAATGTAISYLTNVLLLCVFTQRMLGWNLLSNSVRSTSNR